VVTTGLEQEGQEYIPEPVTYIGLPATDFGVPSALSLIRRFQDEVYVIKK
jgi:hypothetical protein